MEQRLVCDTVRDLLPMYIDHMTSEVSNESIEEHINGCGECRTVLEQMRRPVTVETAPEIKEFGKFLKKSKMSILYWIMGAAAVIAIVTCFIVNLATEKRLSWFYIVLAGIVTGYLPVSILISVRKQKVVKMLAALDGCTFVLLGVIQLVLYYQMGIGGFWYWNKGLPITLLWSAILWISVIVRIKCHAGILTSLVVLTFLAVPGNFLTNVISGYYRGWEDYAADFVSNGLGNTMAAVILLILDIVIYSMRKGKKKDGE